MKKNTRFRLVESVTPVQITRRKFGFWPKDNEKFSKPIKTCQTTE